MEARRFNVRPHQRDILDVRAEAQARGGASYNPAGPSLAQVIERVAETPIVLDDKDKAFIKAHGISDPDAWLADQGLGL